MKRYTLLALVLLGVLISLCGCTKKVITVKDDITKETTETEYVTVDEFEVKKTDDSGKEEIGSLAILIPAGFSMSDSVEGMYISNIYPIDSSNIYYTISDGEDAGFVTDSLDEKKYKESVENGYKSLGENADIKVDSFEKTDFEGIPCYKIRSHYNIGERDVQQLVYIIQATQTHVITYSQTSDDELMYDFLTDEGQIKLVKEISGR